MRTEMGVFLTGRFHDYYDFKDGLLDEDDCEDGDLLLQPKADAAGRMARAGNHTNWGYSGYFLAYLFAEGGARKLLNYQALWPNEENRYPASQERSQTMNRIEASLSHQSGRAALKVKGGWRLA